MPDNHTREERRYNMSRIKSKDTKPEITIRKELFARGFRYRKNVRSLPGCPDIVFPKYRKIILIHGCFWHKHDCGKFNWPTTNSEYWMNKINRNVERDQANKKALEKQGWDVLTVWECQLKKKRLDETIRFVCNWLKTENKRNY